MKHALWLLPLLCAPLFSADSPSTFTNRDVFELEIATDPQISPDGSAVVYVRQSMDIMTDRPRNNIWIVDADGGNHRPLVSGTDNYSSPRWSPSGDRIAYVSAAEGRGPQLYVRWLDTGQTALLTNLREAPAAVAWSPDGGQLAFSMLVPADGPKLADPPSKPEGAVWAPPVTIIDRPVYRFDGVGYLKTGYNQLFVIPADGGTPRQITSGDFDHGPTGREDFPPSGLSWAPDGKFIVFSANRGENPVTAGVESEIWRVAVDNGELRQLTNRVGPDFSPAYSPDGTSISYLGYDDRKMGYDNVHAYVMTSEGGDPRDLTPDLDRSIDAAEWSGDSQMYIRYDDRGRTLLASLSLQGEIEPIAVDLSSVAIGRPYTSSSFSAARNGAYAYTAGSTSRPADVAAGRPGGEALKLTSLNEDLLSSRTLGEVEEMAWRSSADGLEIQGWLLKPPNFDPNAKYPLMLEIHGGPFAAYGPHFAAELQLYAAAGYVVLYANPRGSTSYGYDFANKIHHNYPGQDYDDLMSGVDAVIERGFIDENQQFVTGGSGGGILTAWIVGKTSRFRAAASIKPVINWTSEVLTTDITAFMRDYWFAGTPWDDQAEYWRRSPLSLVGNVTTPTLLMTGEQDHRTPIGESEQFYSALKLRKIDTILVRVPESPHGIAGRPSHLIAKVDNILGWFARYRR